MNIITNVDGRMFSSTGVIVGNKIISCAHCFTGKIESVVASGFGNIDLINSKLKIFPGLDFATIELNKIYKTQFQLIQTEQEFEKLMSLSRSKREIWTFRYDEKKPLRHSLDGYWWGRMYLKFDSTDQMKKGDSGGAGVIRHNKNLYIFGTVSTLNGVTTGSFTNYSEVLLVPTHHVASWVENENIYKRKSAKQVQELALNFMEKHNYDVNPSLSNIKKFSNWYQFAVIKLLVSYRYSIQPVARYIVDINRPFQVDLIRIAIQDQLGSMDEIIKRVAQIKSIQRYNKVTRAYWRRTYLFEVDPWEGRWTSEFLQSFEDALENQGEAVNMETYDERIARETAEEEAWQLEKDQKREKQHNSDLKKWRKLSTAELIAELRRIQGSYISANKLSPLIAVLVERINDPQVVDELFWHVDKGKIKEIGGSNSALILSHMKIIGYHPLITQRLLRLAPKTAGLHHYSNTNKQIVDLLLERISEPGVIEALISIAKRKSSFSVDINLYVFENLRGIKDDPRIVEMLIYIANHPKKYFDRRADRAIKALEERKNEPKVAEALNQISNGKWGSYYLNLISSKSKKILERYRNVLANCRQALSAK